MSENWRLQVSPKLADGTLINLRADTPEEFEQVVGWATQNAAKFIDVVTAITAVNKVPALAGNTASTQVVPDQQNNGGWGAPQQQAPPSFANPATPPPPSCQHGPMVYREAKPGSGKSWKAFFCPTPQGSANQCKPQFLK